MVRLSLLSSIGLLGFFSALLFSFLSCSFWLFFFFTVCIFCCLLAFNQRLHTSSITTKTDIPSSSSDIPSFSSDIPSSSSSPPSGKFRYDVFLSFRGEDTRKNFTDHLYSALNDKGIITFRDDEELERGESIAPNLLKAIEESRCAVVVLSRNYANSSWCLDEIAKIVECMKAMGQKVLPVFYDVDPSDVRHQTGDHFGKAFAKHQKRFEGNPDNKVQTWKDALSQVANLSGWHVQDGFNEMRVVWCNGRERRVVDGEGKWEEEKEQGRWISSSALLRELVFDKLGWWRSPLGWEVVRQECCDEPEKCSRLWLPNEIVDVLDQNKATSAVQSILLQGPTKEDVVHSFNDSFSIVDKLRLLKIQNVKFSGNIKYLSKKLQFLEWHECPLDSFPSDFQPDNLVELHTHSSRIKQLWKGEKGWRMLQLIDMTGSQYLISTPDFTEVPSIEILVLEGCTSLVDVHPSLGSLKKLKFLNMRNCKSVESIPPFTSLDSLRTLILTLCSRLKKFPDIKGNMRSLLVLDLEGSSIEELPPSVECLTGLTSLNLIDCKKLLRFPSSIQCLTSLKGLYLKGCSKLDEIPENLNCVESL